MHVTEKLIVTAKEHLQCVHTWGNVARYTCMLVI